MVCFFAAVPYSPLLLPGFKARTGGRVSATAKALAKLAEDLYLAKPETVVLALSGAPSQTNLVINQAPQMSLDFSLLGDIQTTGEYFGDSGLSYSLREQLETKYPSQIVHEPKLDYRFGLPLLVLLKNLPAVKLVPLTTGQQDSATQLKIGEQLRQVLESTNHRIAVIAIGVLAQTLKKKSPAPYRPEAKEFDHTVIELLKNQDEKGLLEVPAELRKNVLENLYDPLVLLWGAIDRTNVTTDILAYEDSLGVGYLTVNFRLS